MNDYGWDNVVTGSKMPEHLRRNLPEIPKDVTGIDREITLIYHLNDKLKEMFDISNLQQMTEEDKSKIIEEMRSQF